MEQAVKNTIQPNEKQMESIKSTGTVMVLAGPGTGKTFTIIQRLKFMLEQGISPDSILCLTFSEAAANEMKTRLVKEVGTLASPIVIHTYHAFCNEIIKRYPNEFDLLDGADIVDELTSRSLMKECLKELNPTYYRTKWGNAEYFAPELLNNVSEIKKNRITKEKYLDTIENHPDFQKKLDILQADYDRRIKEGKKYATALNDLNRQRTKIGKVKEVWDIYEGYNLKLKKHNLIDFDDMINFILDTFENNEEFLKEVAKPYKYFLVDEYQDTNAAQNEIIFRLAKGSDSNEIFVVGDDDQTIYGFQGAQIDNIEKFLNRFSNSNLICLNENNRSTQPILDLSHDVISQDKTRLEEKTSINKKLTAKNQNVIKQTKKIQLHCFGSPEQERNYIVEQIEKLAKQENTELSQIAVLTRKRDEISAFANLLEAKNIPYQRKEKKSIFEIPSSIITYFYLKSLENNIFYSDKLFALLCNKPFEFNNADYTFLLEQNQLENKKDFITIIRENINRDWQDKQKVLEFIKTYDELLKVKSNDTLRNLIVEIVNRTGILSYFVNTDLNKTENIFAIKKLVEEAENFEKTNFGATVADFINRMDMAFNDKIPIMIDNDDFVQNAVQLLTYHGSKGCEFEYVFLPNLVANAWEKKSNRSKTNLPIEKCENNVSDEDIKRAEELKVLFVGITRAKHSLFLSFSNIINDKTQELTEYLSTVVSDNDNVEKFQHEISGEINTQEIVKSLTTQKPNNVNKIEDFIKARLKDFVLSPTSLNSYLNCPKEFLYSHLLKIPVREGDYTNRNYGSAFHKTLENAIKKAKQEGNYPTCEEMKQEFLKQISKQKLPSELTREEIKIRGQKSIEDYYSQFIQTSPDAISETEYDLGLVPVGDYIVKGFIDRIEKHGEEYSIYDYKTGGAKPKTQIADGKEYEKYLNQLRFYKLAFETLNAGAKVTDTGLIFVEESEKNFHVQLTEEDNVIIKGKILETYKNINDLNFDPVKKDENHCKFCAFKQFCSLD